MEAAVGFAPETPILMVVRKIVDDDRLSISTGSISIAKLGLEH